MHTQLRVMNLVGGEQWKVVWWVGDDVSLGGGVLSDVAQSVSEPIETDAQNAKRPQRMRKQLAVVDTAFLQHDVLSTTRGRKTMTHSSTHTHTPRPVNHTLCQPV